MNSVSQARSGHFDNLVAILAVAAALSLMALAADIAERYATTIDTTAYTASKNVVGYVRPQTTAPAGQDMVHAPFRNPPMPPTEDLTVSMSQEQAHTLKQRFEQAVALLHAKQYDYAIAALSQVIELQPKLPEAYVNIGFAYLGLEQWDTAIMAFNKASDLKPEQANAYYGLALAFEGNEEYEAALGAMRSYIHLSTPQDPFLAKARSALWEWEEILGRVPGPRNPNKGDAAAIPVEGSQPRNVE
jgi:tetratricopeptide (TPR) repeat protein